MSAKSSEVASLQTPQQFEILDAKGFASRLGVPTTWVFEQTRSRATDVIPHLRFGKYVRFRWNSPELNVWIARRMRGGKQ